MILLVLMRVVEARLWPALGLVEALVMVRRVGTFFRGQGPGSEGLHYPEDSSVAAYSGSQHGQQIGSLEILFYFNFIKMFFCNFYK